MTSISGATILVTGGQRGLGKAFVDTALQLGATKVYATARNPVASNDPRIIPLPLDVTDSESVAALAEHIGDVSIVINNAGAAIQESLMQASIDQVKDLFDTNVFGVLRITQLVAPILAKNGGGALVNIHSALSWASGAGIYGATKAALWSLTNSARLELAGQGTQVLGVHLGYTETDMTSALNVVKNDPLQVAHDALLALEKGHSEALTDEVSRKVKAALSGPVEGLSFSMVDGEIVLASEIGKTAASV